MITTVVFDQDLERSGRAEKTATHANLFERLQAA